MQCSLHESKIKTAIVHNRNTAIVHNRSTAIVHKTNTAIVHKKNTAVGHKKNTAVGHKRNTAIVHKKNTAVGNKRNTAIVHKKNTAIVHKKNTAVGHKQSHTALVHTFLWLPKHCNGTAQPTSWLTRSLFIETNLRNRPLMRAGSATEFSTTRNNYQSPEKKTHFFPTSSKSRSPFFILHFWLSSWYLCFPWPPDHMRHSTDYVLDQHQAQSLKFLTGHRIRFQFPRLDSSFCSAK